MWIHKLGQLLASRKFQLVAVILFVLFSFLLVQNTQKEKWWDAILDPVIGFSTLLVAILVYLSEWRSDWEDERPKRLTVRFIYNQRLVMICKEAHLASEADIRPWGQQIGRQMAGEDLQFYAFFETSDGRPIRNQQGDIYKPYYLSMFLSEIPERLQDKLLNEAGVIQYLRWQQVDGGRPKESFQIHPEVLPPMEQNKNL